MNKLTISTTKNVKDWCKIRITYIQFKFATFLLLVQCKYKIDCQQMKIATEMVFHCLLLEVNLEVSQSDETRIAESGMGKM